MLNDELFENPQNVYLTQIINHNQVRHFPAATLSHLAALSTHTAGCLA